MIIENYENISFLVKDQYPSLFCYIKPIYEIHNLIK